MSTFRLVPGLGGHLIPTEIESEPAYRWVEDGVTYESAQDNSSVQWFDENGVLNSYHDYDTGLKKKPSSCREIAHDATEAFPEITFDELDHRILALLESRTERLAEQKMNRDDLIESLVLKGRNMGDRIQSSRDPDARMVNVVDRLSFEESKANREISADLAMIKKIDRRRFKLPIHLRTIVDLIFYKNLPLESVAKQMSFSIAKTSHMIKLAVHELSILTR